MPRLTVRLPEDLNRDLESAAESLERTKSAVVRMALRDLLLRLQVGGVADRVAGILGSPESGIPDLAEDRRRHVLTRLEKGTVLERAP